MEWTLDNYDCWNLHIGQAHVWISKRPVYCDRGHYYANVEGIPSIDGADCFPRYFMNLERAKAEMAEWLQWRIKSQNESYESRVNKPFC